MPGIFGIIARDRGRAQDLEPQYEKMARLLSHLDYYQVETLAGPDHIMGWIGVPFRGYRWTRKDEKTGNRAAFFGYVYGWRGPCKVGDPANSEPVSMLPLDSVADLSVIPDQINGFFNVALYDRERDLFYLATDRQACNRLYYYENDDVIAFAPEVKAFLALESFRPELDLDGIADFFNYGYLVGGRTFFKRATLLNRASILPIENRRVGELRRYWWPEFSPEIDGDPEALARELYDKARDVLVRQVGRQKKFCVALSGGMDSRMVSHLVHKLDAETFYYSHGDHRSDDARIARVVADTIGFTDKYDHIEGDPCSLGRLGAQATWLVDGMASLAASSLLDVLLRYPPDPLEYEFLNSLLSGALNFTVCYGTEADIVADLSFEDKIKRVANVMGLSYLTDDYYSTFRPEYRDYFRSVARPHMEAEMRRVEGIGHFFAHEKDVFSLETRVHRLSHQYDLNKLFYNSHQVLIDDEIIAMRDRLPLNWQVARKVYRVMFQKLVPDLARITYQQTGVDLFHYPSERSLRWRQRMERVRYLIGRVSLGMINLKDHNTYVHPDAWYREQRENSRFVEGILLDDRTEARGYYDMEWVRILLAKERRGSNNVGTLATLTTFELFNRYFIDGESPPSLEG
jgi:asparagine synthase (glutamine-hydrolysing)